MKLTGTGTTTNGLRAPRHIFLLLEWPILVVTLGLQAWGLYALSDALQFTRLSGTPAGADSGRYGFSYGTQLMTYSSTYTRTITTTESDATRTFTSVSQYTATRSLFPYVYGTAYYSSEYSAIGSIPPPISQTPTSSSSSSSPTATPTATLAPRAWINPSGPYDRGLYNDGSDNQSFLAAMQAVWAVVLAALAIRVVLTPVYFAFGGARSNATHRDRRYWAIAMVTWTTIAMMLLLGAGMAGWAFIGSWYQYEFKSSPGLVASVVFYGVACITTIVASGFVGRDLDKINKIGRAYTEAGHMNVTESKRSMTETSD